MVRPERSCAAKAAIVGSLPRQPLDGVFADVAYGGGSLVAVGRHGAVTKSDAGKRFRSFVPERIGDNATSGDYEHVAYSPNAQLWAAAGGIQLSDDGEATWRMLNPNTGAAFEYDDLRLGQQQVPRDAVFQRRHPCLRREEATGICTGGTSAFSGLASRGVALALAAVASACGIEDPAEPASEPRLSLVGFTPMHMVEGTTDNVSIYGMDLTGSIVSVQLVRVDTGEIIHSDMAVAESPSSIDFDITFERPNERELPQLFAVVLRAQCCDEQVVESEEFYIIEDVLPKNCEWVSANGVPLEDGVPNYTEVQAHATFANTLNGMLVHFEFWEADDLFSDYHGDAYEEIGSDGSVSVSKVIACPGDGAFDDTCEFYFLAKLVDSMFEPCRSRELRARYDISR